MKQETQAILQVAKLVAFAGVCSAGTMLALTYIEPKTLAITCGIFATAFFLKCMYDIALSDIKYRETLKEMTKK
jgi:hypothetical protein